jgi:hypothetical protein
MPQEEPSTRAIAGLLLKNTIRVYFATIQRDVLAYVKALSIKGLGDQDVMVRGIIGNVITTIVTRGGLADWPQVLPALMELLDSQDYNIVEVSVFSILLIMKCYIKFKYINLNHSRELSVLYKRFAKILLVNSTKILKAHGLSII